MADDADRPRPRPAAPVATAPSATSASHLPVSVEGDDEYATDVRVEWPRATYTYRFFYTWAGEVGDCCGPGTESVQAAITPTEVRLLCLCCKKTRVGHSHLAQIVI